MGSDQSRFRLEFQIEKLYSGFSSKPLAAKSHYLTLGDNTTRVIELDSGADPDRQYLYAMIMAHRTPWPTVQNFNMKSSAAALSQQSKPPNDPATILIKR